MIRSIISEGKVDRVVRVVGVTGIIITGILREPVTEGSHEDWYLRFDRAVYLMPDGSLFRKAYSLSLFASHVDRVLQNISDNETRAYMDIVWQGSSGTVH